MRENYQKHGLSRDPVYKIWGNIKDRCTNPNNPYSRNYLGRGIKLYPEWQIDFLSFFNAIGSRPSPKHTVERIDNEKDYEPGNLRWATRKEQAHNMRKNVVLEFGGRSQVLAAWADELGFAPSTLWNRLFRRGMPVDIALTWPRNMPWMGL